MLLQKNKKAKIEKKGREMNNYATTKRCKQGEINLARFELHVNVYSERKKYPLQEPLYFNYTQTYPQYQQAGGVVYKTLKNCSF
ncbi:hypothetical protein FRZ06_13385 [Anoxybacterium hadale]|uniref:Uncharacterized protein n=1 Tax=Anoxybacterium hadale TaxID=3408580 RepID=A0ACD1ACQ7_9FIRM|nr:hypothetical protein FRZ06_13385 [Clostridiales bacterium]